MSLRRLLYALPVLLLSLGLGFGADAKPALLSAKNQPEAAASCTPSRPADYVPIERRYRKGLIFRIDGCAGSAPSYVLGTMHSDNPAFAPLIEDVQRLIDETHAAGFEYVEDERTQQVSLQYMFIPSTTPRGLDSMLTPQEFKTLSSLIASRTSIPEQVTRRLRPWAAALLLQYPKPKADGVALDSRLQQYAAQQRKPLFGLETPEQQYEVFSGIAPAQQLQMLKEGIADIQQIDASNEELAQAYVARDLIRIHRLAQDTFADMKDTKLALYMREHLIRRRNVVMAEGMAKRLPEGGQFVAVGALHLFGKDGVLSLLEAKGYSIQQVD